MQTGQPVKSGGGNAMIIVAGVVGVLALVGCCAAGAMFWVAKRSASNYVNAARDSEATSNLRSLGLSECSYASGEHITPEGTLAAAAGFVTAAGPVPPAPPPGHTKVIGDFASDSGFHAIGFEPADPVYFSYRVAPDPSAAGGIVLTAQGDPDGDGTLTTFESHCTFSAATSDCNCTPPAQSR